MNGSTPAPTLLTPGASGRGAALTARLGPFLRAAALSSVDLHVVDQLGRLGGEDDPEVLLALALAVRAPRHGHICVDLSSVGKDELLPYTRATDRDDADGASDGTDRDQATQLSLPIDRAAWVERVGASPLVQRAEGGTKDPRPFVLDGSLLYTRRYRGHQDRLAEALRSRALRRRTVGDPALLALGLSELFDGPTTAFPVDRQQAGAAMACLRGLTVLSGGPGTGKTYTVRAVLALLWSQWAAAGELADLRVALAAPTGKASARMKEAILAGLDDFLQDAVEALPEGRAVQELREFLVSLQPSTIHRLLRWNPANPTRFRHDASSPVPFDVVVVDEASMIDFALMTRLVDAIADDASLVLLGDKNQLASVEAGTVLADLCGPTRVERMVLSEGFVDEVERSAGLSLASQVDLRADEGPWDCMVQLDRSRRFREDRGVGQFARACLAEPFDLAAAVGILADDGRFEDVQLAPHGESGQLTDATSALLVQGYRPYLERLLAGPEPGQERVALHREVLALFDRFRVLCAHRRGRLGVAGLNDAVLALLKRAGIRGFRPGGEHWPGRPILVRRNDYVVGRYNGDVGIEVPDDDGELVVAFPGEAGQVEYLSPTRLPEHQTVFAMTIHKSQGSEFERVLVVLPDQPSPILTRELVYTAVTRAKDGMTLLGSAELLEAALKERVRRASGLQAELWGDHGGART